MTTPYCECGHRRGGHDGWQGHGPCRRCPCEKYSWVPSRPHKPKPVKLAERDAWKRTAVTESTK